MQKSLGMDSISKEEKVQWWENIECIINCKTSFEPGRAIKSLPSFLSSFLRCHKDIANLAGYFGHPWPNPSKIILSTCKTLSCLSARKTSASLLSSFLRYCKTLRTYFAYFWHIWPHSSKIVVSYKKNCPAHCNKNKLHPSFLSWDIAEVLKTCYSE